VTPARILAMSSGTPITPVDAISTWSEVHPAATAPAAAMSRATRMPASPVQALAQPLLMTTAWARPPERDR